MTGTNIKGDVTLKWADRIGLNGQAVSEGWCVEYLSDLNVPVTHYIFGASVCVSSGGGPRQAISDAHDSRNGIHWTGKVTAIPPKEHFVFGTETICTACAAECEAINKEEQQCL